MLWITSACLSKPGKPDRVSEVESKTTRFQNRILRHRDFRPQPRFQQTDGQMMRRFRIKAEQEGAQERIKIDMHIVIYSKKRAEEKRLLRM